MIISRKRYQEEINKAVTEALDKCREKKYVDDQIEMAFRQIDRFGARIEALEKIVHGGAEYVQIDERTVAPVKRFS